jgi:hypothetical protein
MGIPINEAKQHNLINLETQKLLSKACKCCKQFELSDSLKNVTCSNPECKARIYKRVAKFCKHNNISLDTTSIINIVDKLGLKTPYLILELDDMYKRHIVSSVEVPNIIDVLDNIEDIKSNNYYLYEIIEMCGIDNLTTVAKALALGYNSVAELYNELDKVQLSYITEKLGLEESNSISLALIIYNNLDSIYEELVYACHVLEVRQYTNRIRIAFNDVISNFMNKADVIDYLNNHFEYTFVHTEIVDDKTDILIKNVNNKGIKYRRAVEVNDISSAKYINSGDLDLDNVGQLDAFNLKPAGYSIYIDNLENIIKRLNMLRGKGVKCNE